MLERVLRFSKNGIGIMLLIIAILILLTAKGLFWGIPALPRVDLGQPWFLHVVVIAGGLLLSIPILLAAFGFLRWLFPTIPWKKPIGILGTIWILALMTLIWTGVHTYQHFQKMKETVTQWTATLPWKDKAVLDIKQLADTERIQFGSLAFGLKDRELLQVGTQIKLVATSHSDFEVSFHQRSFGEHPVETIMLPIEQKADTLILPDHITYPNSKPYSGEGYTVVIGIPKGKILILGEAQDAASIHQSEDILMVESESGTYYKVH